MIVQIDFLAVKEQYDNAELWFNVFKANKKYLVLECGLDDFRILAEKGRSSIHRPYLYSSDLFNIIDDSIPQDWDLIFSDDREAVFPVNYFGIQTYADLKKLEQTKGQSIYTFPHELGLYGFTDYCDLKESVLERVGTYLEEIRQQQFEMNQK